jgi:hypothetical protein
MALKMKTCYLGRETGESENDYKHVPSKDMGLIFNSDYRVALSHKSLRNSIKTGSASLTYVFIIKRA